MKRYGFIPNMPDASRFNRRLHKTTGELPAESSLYADSAYTDYEIEDGAFENQSILLKVQRRGNSKRPDSHEAAVQKLKMRKCVEVTISDIKKLFPRTIHTVTLDGFIIKLTLFIFGLQLNKIFNK